MAIRLLPHAAEYRIDERATTKPTHGHAWAWVLNSGIVLEGAPQRPGARVPAAGGFGSPTDGADGVALSLRGGAYFTC